MILPTKALAISALLCVSSHASKMFPFRIRAHGYSSQRECEGHSDKEKMKGDFGIRENKCHTPRKPFSTFALSKDHTPFGKNHMDSFGTCTLKVWSEEDCTGDVIKKFEPVNVETYDIEEWKCLGVDDEGMRKAKSMGLLCCQLRGKMEKKEACLEEYGIGEGKPPPHGSEQVPTAKQQAFLDEFRDGDGAADVDDDDGDAKEWTSGDY